MGHHAEYVTHFELSTNGLHLTRIVEALWKNKREVVFTETDDGYMEESDHLYLSSMGGYSVNFTGERGNWYYGYSKMDKPYYRAVGKRPNVYDVWVDKTETLRNLEVAQPDLKYFIKKTREVKNSALWFDLFKQYKKNPEIESLLDLKLYSIALDQRLFKLNKEKRCLVINFIKDNAGEDFNLTEALFCIKHNLKLNELAPYRENKYQYNFTKTIQKYDVDKETFRHYKQYLEKLGRLKDKYWTEPNNKDKFWELYAKAQEEYEAVLEAEELARKQKEAAEEAKKQEEQIKLFKKFAKKIGAKYKATIGKYELYVPTELQDIIEQAKELNQCLISMRYDKKMLDGKCLLIFIKTDSGERVATAELEPKTYKVRQFYADEYDRNNCKPNEEVQQIFNQYCTNVLGRATC